MSSKGKRLVRLGASFLDGAARAFDPFPYVEYRRFALRDPREDATRLGADAQQVAEDFRRSVARSADELRGT